MGLAWGATVNRWGSLEKPAGLAGLQAALLPAPAPSDTWPQSSSLGCSNAVMDGVERGHGDTALPTAAFPSSSAARLKADPLLGFALQHSLLGFGISPSHYLLSKSRQSWVEAGGRPRFSHLLRGSQPGTAAPPPKSGPRWGPGSSRNPSREGRAARAPVLSERLRSGHCKYCCQRHSPALVSAWHMPRLQIQLDRVAFENSIRLMRRI